ncbi:MAG: hypothetical protein JOZ15_02960 [Acidobacteria bacterium]|nr:hypothetical protein [Acidobacteriota bacterium]
MTTMEGAVAIRPWPRLLWAAMVTAALLAAAWALRWVPLPGVDSAVLAGAAGAQVRMTLGSLWTNSLVSGFLLVELFSLSPPGRRWRHGGPAGRTRLDRAALGVSLAIAAAQGAGLAIYAEKISDPFGLVAVPHPGYVFRILTVLTLTAATAALFALGSAIGEWGIGNGFCWLLVLAVVEGAVRQWRQGPRHLGSAEPTEVLFGALWLVPVIALVAWLELRGPAVPVVTAAGETLAVQLPPLPQGVVPVNLAQLCVALSYMLPALARLTWLSRLAPLRSVAATVLLLPAFSLLAYVLFGNRSRLAANLRPAADAPAPEVRATLDRQWLRTTAALTAASVALYVVARFIPAAPLIELSAIVVLAAFVLDLCDELLFTRRHGRTVRLLQLDNVHLAAYLQALLRRQDLDVLARAFRFRSLFYFLNPLVKIELRVPAEQLEAAAGLVAAQELRTL